MNITYLPSMPSGEPVLMPCRQALALLNALDQCQHPKAERLRAQLNLRMNPDQLARVSEDVRHLVYLSFGPAEARRRLKLD